MGERERGREGGRGRGGEGEEGREEGREGEREREREEGERDERERIIIFHPIAPTGSPNITSVSSTRLREISLSWTEVLPDQRNGMITNYMVIFQSRDNASIIYNVTVRKRATTLNASNGISAGMTYNITVLASTRVGQGPQSSPVMQETIVEPPNIVNGAGAEPITVIMNAVSQTTIPITLDLQSMLSGSFSHFWVIAMKVDASYAASIQQNGTVRFPNGSVISDNSSFVLYSDNIPNNTPYIVAEVSASRLMRSINFILGDEGATPNLNDQPSLYRNGPLTEGTQYTVFLWGFPASVPVSLKAIALNSTIAYMS